MSSGGVSGGRERRAHRRLAFRLPVECRSDRTLVRTITQNICTGGMYLELDKADFSGGDQLQLEFTLPAAEGVSPYPGRAKCTAEVLRVHRLPSVKPGGVTRYGIAARFLDRLRISYGPSNHG